MSGWRHKIKIKHTFVTNVTKQAVINTCNAVIPSLKRIIESESKAKDLDIEDKEHLIEETERIQDNFSFLKDLAEGTIKESEWSNYGFDGNFEKQINYDLSDLYDLGDSNIYRPNKITQKFLWVE